MNILPVNAWLRLFRPWNAAIAAAAVWVGWACLGTRPLGPPEWQLALWGSIAMFLLVAAGNADNDAVDAETDRVNRPRRPIVSGAVSRGAARAAAFALYAAGILAAWIGTPVHGMLAAAMAGLLLAYNRSLKGTPVAGNLVIALLCALAVWFTEFPLPPRGALAAATFAFLATFARELVKDAEDVTGDRAAGLRTLAVVSGTPTARKLAFASTVVLLALLPAPMLMGYGWPYAAVAALLAGPALAPLLGELAKPDANFARAQKLLKLLMLAGMVALWAGTLGR
ncbi:MAG TPA: UbiA family prenyltransferase [Fibrobacteria bacterium]|jgi:4-hydroxybenzoate polyprenyltransferase|nr:UbiA family prenyltransferase [Fibrobacteria bacterium]